MKNHLLNLLTHLNQDLFEIIVCCPNGTLAKEIRWAGFRVITLPLKGELSFLNDWKTTHQLVKILREEKVAILHAHSAKAGLVGRVAARLARTPVVFYTTHNSIFYEEWSSWKKILLATGERFLSKTTDRIIAVSETLRQELIAKEGLPSDKIITIYNGIETGRTCAHPFRERRHILRELGLPSLGQVVGTVARLAPQKGIIHFLKAAAMLARDYQVNFLVVGDGPLRQQLQAEAISLGLANRVVFAGERRDVPAILPVFDVFVLPSLTEGFPLTILEALAAGRPVVATRVGGIPEIIKDNHTGLLVRPGEPAELALAIARLLRDRQEALAMGRAGQKYVCETFSAEKMAGRVAAEYRKALQAKGLLPEGDGWPLPGTGWIKVKK